jgi:superfamily I DNA/RNA helicase
VTEERRGTVSAFNGPQPLVQVFDDQIAERDAVARWLTERAASGVAPHEFGVFVRSEAELDRATAAVRDSKLPFRVLDAQVESASGHVSISTMHLAKGLEFRAVAVMACDDEVLPLQSRISAVGDDGDLAEVYETERYLLYVACTRARDQLLVTACEPASEFLADLSTRNNAGE